MNFEFLKGVKDFQNLYKYCNDAEKLAYEYHTQSVASARNALESLVKSFYVMKYGSYPENDTLFELIQDGCFSSYLDDNLLQNVHYVRKIGNNGAHGETVSKKENISCLHALHEVVKEMLITLGLEGLDVKPFDKTVYDSKPESVIPDNVETEGKPDDAENIKKYKQNIDINFKAKSHLNLNEEETRELYIDAALQEAGWDVCNIKGAIKPGMACIEIKLEGMPNNQGVGYADYVLYDDDCKPLAVIEAKKTSTDEVVGSQQAKLYADCIEKLGFDRPIVFYTNGYVIKMVDNSGYPARRMFGYLTKDELHSLMIRKDLKNISDTRIDPTISDRYFIQHACTSVCTAFNERRRKALVVMATGTGKTRCAISIVDVLQKYDWAKRVLFLADRTALINQAKNAFAKFLPNSTLCALSSDDQKDYDARVCLSTYQTMINLIDCDNRKFGVGHFDLIIIDECHRSVYNKYKAIFNYFDSLILGLTATPREQVDQSTYELFDLPKGEPTYAYDYETAVKEGFLVDFHPFERTTQLLKSGLKYDELSDEEKEQYETLFSDEDGDVPEEISGEEFKKRIMNSDTIDKVIQTVMNEGMKVNSGQKLGKTIIFATNHFHAQAIVDRFKVLYPQKGDNYCQLIDNYINYAQTVINDFSQKDKEPTIAVSVDMLDTGIDVPEVVNLVFFKRVYSKIKFWQMIGRGTRVCKELNVLSPGHEYFEDGNESPVIPRNDKQGFYIFDFCDVFEFFGSHPDGKEAKSALNLSQKIFELKLDMVSELQKAEHQENEERKKYYEKYKAECIGKIRNLNRNLINVKTNLKYVEKYSEDDTWSYINLLNLKEMKKWITPIIDSDSDDENDKYFDLWVFNMELEEILGDKDYSKAIQKVTNIASALLGKLAIPAVLAKKDFIKEICTNEFWKTINLDKLEKVRTEIRELIKFIDREYLTMIQSSFSDQVIVKEGGNTPRPNFKNYKDTVVDYLLENVDSGAIYKIRNIIPLTMEDIYELYDILCVKLGSKEDYENVAGGHDFGVFVRSIVGLDREAVTKLFGEYLQEYNFNEEQLEFLHEIIDFVLENGDIEAQNLLNCAPFKNKDYIDIFGNTEPLYKFIDTLHSVVHVNVA